MAGDLVAIGELEDAVGALGAQLHRLLRRDYLHSKTLRLHHRSPRQICATQACRKSEVVLDARAQASLSAGSLAIYHHRLQSLGSAIHRCRQPARTSADDGKII